MDDETGIYSINVQDGSIDLLVEIDDDPYSIFVGATCIFIYIFYIQSKYNCIYS